MKRLTQVLLIRVAATLSVASVLALAGCTPPSPAPAPAMTSVASPAGTSFNLVVLGDSLTAEPPRNCDGCRSWVAQNADHWEKKVGMPVEVRNDAKDDSQLSGLDEELHRDAVIADLATADAVVVWIGTNEGPPWNEDTPCHSAPGSTAAEQVAVVSAYTERCIDATVRFYRDRYAQIFDRIVMLSPKARQRSALTIFSNWRGNPGLSEPEFKASQIDEVNAKVVPIYDAWNAALCAAAAEENLSCVDVYHLVNGRDGRGSAAAVVGSDFTHLSQPGHDAVAKLLNG